MNINTEICNMALGHLGNSTILTDANTDPSPAAKALRIFYEPAILGTFEDFDWGFARKYGALALVEENPNSRWRYSYTFPTDCAAPREILSGVYNDSRTSRVPYEVAKGNAGRLIFTNKEDAELKYTTKDEDAASYSYNYKMCASIKLAIFSIPKLAAGDPFNIGARLEQKYGLELSKAQANDANAEEPKPEPSSELQRFRNGGYENDGGVCR